MKLSLTGKVSSYLPSASFYLLLVYSLLLLFPISFQYTMPYLDSSWGYDLNYFLHSRYHFGPDVVFTYGPLGFLNNPQNVGNDIWIALAVHVSFWASLGIQLIFRWLSGARASAVAFCIAFLLGHRLYYDYWDYFVVALSLITILKCMNNHGNVFDAVLLPSLFGISFLLKFSAFLMIASMLSIYTADLLRKTAASWRTATWLALCFVSPIVAYLLYDASFPHLIDYVKGCSQLTLGFATAMSIQSTQMEIGLALVCCFVLVVNVGAGVWARRLLWSESLLIVALAWMVFRHGFVRADTSHVSTFFAFSLVLMACLFSSWGASVATDRLLAVSSLIFVAIALKGLSGHYPPFTVSNWWPPPVFAELTQLSHWRRLAFSLDHLYDSAFAQLPGMTFAAQVEGKRVMVFPHSNPYVTKFKFDMFPIYPMQGYAAFTSYLDRRAARNLIEAKPPVDKIILAWAPIDGRNQFLDTPALSLAFLANFRLEKQAPAALLLSHRQSALPLHIVLQAHEAFVPDAWVPLPTDKEPLAMSIRLKQSAMGSLMTTLFVQEAVYLDLETKSGARMHFRVPPQTLSTPGLISFVPSTLDEMALFWGSEPLKNRVVRLRLAGPGLRWTVSNGYDFFEVQNLGAPFVPVS